MINNHISDLRRCIPRIPLVALACSGLCLTSLGCNQPGVSGTAPFTRSDSSGVEIIQSVAPTWPGTPRIEPEPFLRIGRAEGESADVFGAVSNPILLPDDRIAVPELFAREIRVFDRTGQHLRTLGREGDGPGEFQAIGHVQVNSDHSVAVFDGRLYRTSIWSLSTGEFRSFPTRLDMHHFLLGTMRDGSSLYYNPGSYRPGRLPQGMHWDSSAVVRLDRTGQIRQDLITLPVIQRLIGADGRQQGFELRAWSTRAADPDGFYWAMPERYVIQHYDSDGRLQRSLRRPIEPRMIDAEMRRQYETAYLAWVTETQGENAARDQASRFENTTYAPTLPLFTTAFVDRDQRLWVGAWPWPWSPQAQVSRWSIHAPGGEWLGDLEVPEGLLVTDSEGDVVLGIWRDEFDVPYVQLHRMSFRQQPDASDNR